MFTYNQSWFQKETREVGKGMTYKGALLVQRNHRGWRSQGQTAPLGLDVGKEVVSVV